jgi:hypothetical protein
VEAPASKALVARTKLGGVASMALDSGDRALHGMGGKGHGAAGGGRGGAGSGGWPWRRWSIWRRSFGRWSGRRRPSRRGRAAASGGGGGAGSAVERSRESERGENEVGNFDLGLSP